MKMETIPFYATSSIIFALAHFTSGKSSPCVLVCNPTIAGFHAVMRYPLLFTVFAITILYFRKLALVLAPFLLLANRGYELDKQRVWNLLCCTTRGLLSPAATR